MSGRPQPTGWGWQVWRDLEDRCRIPWPGGARSLPPEAFVPPIVVPAVLAASRGGAWLLVFAHVAAAAITVAAHRVLLPKRPSTTFFAVWAGAEAVSMLVVYELEVVRLFALPNISSFRDNFVLLSLLAAATFFAWRLRRMAADDLIKGPLPSTDGGEYIRRYCRACRGFVFGRDHHCVFLSTCICTVNRVTFNFFLICTSLALLYYASLLFSSVCGRVASLPPSSEEVLFPLDCSGFSTKFGGDAPLVYACGVHALVVAVLVGTMLLRELLAFAWCSY